MILGVQILGIFFALFMLYITFIKRKRDEFTFKESFAWILMWIAFVFVTLFPRSITFIAKDVFNLTRPLDFYIIVGFMFMIGINFYIYAIIRKTQKKVDLVVRRIAIKKAYVPDMKGKSVKRVKRKHSKNKK